MEAITINVVSDVVCPWCYLGKKRLDKAIENVKDDLAVSVTFRPYQLNPDMPAARRKAWRGRCRQPCA